MGDNEMNGEMNNKKSKKYRKDKPWDTDEIDHWKIDQWKPEYMPAPLLEESSYAVLFPKYRELYLKQNWKNISDKLKNLYHIAAELNLLEGSITVKTTRKTNDPFIILKARDFIKLLARSIPYEKAFDIFDDDVNCDIIKIGNLISNKDRFLKRRLRIIGPNGQTLKALELLTNCYIFVQGNTVSAMGSFKGLKQVRKIVTECIQNNYHPIYSIKRLMIIRELEKDPKLKNENWERFLPKFRNRKNTKNKSDKQEGKVKPKKSKIVKEKKEKSLFPPLPTKSKIDLQIESGEYFLKEMERKKLKNDERKKLNQEKKQERKRKRAEAFNPPKEDVKTVSNKKDTKKAKNSEAKAVKKLTKKIKSKLN